MKSSRGGWGFKIDYAAAIADDDARITWAIRSIEHGLYKRLRGGDARFDIVTLLDLCMEDPSVFYRLGYTPQDLADLADETGQEDLWDRFPELPDARQPRESHARLTEVCRDISGWMYLFRDEAEAKAELRRAKASRARHVRNQKKFDTQEAGEATPGPDLSPQQMLDDAARALGWRTDFACGDSPITWDKVLHEITTLATVQKKR